MSEVASAYVSLIPSYRGGTAEIAKQLGGPSEQAGQEAGTSLGKGMLSGLAKLGIAGAVAGIFQGAVSASTNKAKLTAALGLSPKQATTAAHVAGKLYAGAFSDDMGEINDAVKVVSQSLTGIGNGKELQKLSGQALSLSHAFGTDVTGNVNAAAQLIRTGLAKNAQQAFDIIATGEQNGADKAGDLLDTFNEYGTQFRKLGLTGPKALGLISQAIQGGARDSDKAADALKEFSIRAVDGSKTTARGFKMLGLNAGQMAEQIAAGGSKASAGLSTVLDRLRGIKDPAKQSRAAVALFGTQAEDLGKALYAMDPATASAAKGMAHLDGAAGRVTKNMQDAVDPFQRFKQQVSATFKSLGAQALPVLRPFLGLIKKAGKPLAIVGTGIAGLVVAGKAVEGVKKLGKSMKDAVDTAKKLAGGVKSAASAVKDYGRAALDGAKAAGRMAKSLALSTAAYVRQGIAAAASAARTVIAKTASLAMAAASKAWAAAQWLLNAAMDANPLTLIITAVVALVAAVVIAYKKFKWFRDLVHAVWAGIKKATQAAWKVLKAVFKAIWTGVKFVVKIWRTEFEIAKKIVTTVFRAIKATVTTIIHAVKSVISGVLHTISSIIRNVLRGISSVWHSIWGGIKSAVVNVWNGIRSFVGGAIHSVWGTIRSVGHSIASAWRSIWHGMKDTVVSIVREVKSIVSGIWDGVTGGLKAALNGAISLLNGAIGYINRDLIDNANRLPFVNIPHIPTIPSLAKGGIIDPQPGGRLVRVAEAGQAEAVIPLDRLDAMLGKRGGNAPLIGHLELNELNDPAATAQADARRLQMLGAA